LIATQSLLQELFIRLNWFVKQYSSTESLERLFFAKTSCQNMTKRNWKMLIIDCIYKINWYDMFYASFSKWFLQIAVFTLLSRFFRLKTSFHLHEFWNRLRNCINNFIFSIFLSLKQTASLIWSMSFSWFFLMLNMLYALDTLIKTLSRIANLFSMMKNHEKLFINIDMMLCTQKSKQYTKKLENLCRISMKRIIDQLWIIYEMNF
jgi:transposase